MRTTAVSLLFVTLLACMGQATATKPATSSPFPPPPPMAHPKEPIVCPDIDALIKSIPAELWPDVRRGNEQMVADGAKFREWSDKNIAGKQIDYSAVKPQMGVGQGGFGLEIMYPYAGRANTEVHIVISAPKGQEIKETKRAAVGMSLQTAQQRTTIVFIAL